MYFSRRNNPPRDTIRSFQRRVSTCAANLCMEKLFALCQHGGRDENASLSPFTRSRLQEKENPSLFVRLPPPPPEYRRNSLLDEIRPFVERAREQSQLFDNGAANFPIKTFIHPFIHSVELVYIERRSTKFQQMANSWLFLPPPPPPPSFSPS